jgi:hypothetical protein
MNLTPTQKRVFISITALVAVIGFGLRFLSKPGEGKPDSLSSVAERYFGCVRTGDARCITELMSVPEQQASDVNESKLNTYLGVYIVPMLRSGEIVDHRVERDSTQVQEWHVYSIKIGDGRILEFPVTAARTPDGVRIAWVTWYLLNLGAKADSAKWPSESKLQIARTGDHYKELGSGKFVSRVLMNTKLGVEAMDDSSFQKYTHRF